LPVGTKSLENPKAYLIEVLKMNPFYSLLTQSAKEEGFSLFGGVDLDKVNDWQKQVDFFDQWLAKNFDGEMQYLRRGRERRVDPKKIFAEARSIFCVAESYLKSEADPGAQSPRYARYLQGEDYHLWFPKKLEHMMERVALAWDGERNPPLKWTVCVDTRAVLERSWAALSGLGWIGKNTLLINAKQGSYLFLGEILINVPLNQRPTLQPDYCGHCTKCIDACPTHAIQYPGGLDARTCISYLTLEKREEFGVSEVTKKQMGSWVAGCDICMDVCPFNQKPLRAHRPLSRDDTLLTDWNDLLNETEEEYKIRIAHSSLKRVKWKEFRRNLENAYFNYKEKTKAKQ
jgi:epoxyqueuosine reductase